MCVCASVYLSYDGQTWTHAVWKWSLSQKVKQCEVIHVWETLKIMSNHLFVAYARARGNGCVLQDTTKAPQQCSAGHAASPPNSLVFIWPTVGPKTVSCGLGGAAACTDCVQWLVTRSVRGSDTEIWWALPSWLSSLLLRTAVLQVFCKLVQSYISSKFSKGSKGRNIFLQLNAVK